MICGSCRPRVQNCPQCRAVYKGHRLVFAEKMLEMVPVPCKYNEEGCQVELVWIRMERHEKECPVADCLTKSEQKFWMRRLAKKLTKFFRSSSKKGENYLKTAQSNCSVFEPNLRGY